MESQLAKADSFYKLNNILVNKSKSEILIKECNRRNEEIDKNDSEMITFNFGNSEVKLPYPTQNQSARFLGVWLNLSKQRKYVLMQAKDIVKEVVTSLKKKRVTDKQLLYIYNMIIVPRLEYRTQMTFLTENECNSIVSPFRKIFKNKLSISSTAPNSIMNNPNLYNFRNFYDVQIQAKLTNFIIQINTLGLLGNITKIRLQQIQQDRWLRYNPLYQWPYSMTTGFYKSNIRSMLSLSKINNITFEVTPDSLFKIEEGKYELRNILPTKIFEKFRKYFAQKSIMFLDQFTTIDGSSLLQWKDVAKKRFLNLKKVAKIPKWFKSLEILVIKNLNGLRYIHDNLITPAFNFKGHQYKLITPNESYDWVAIYSTTTRQPIIGKLLMKDFHQGSIIIEHWKINDILSLHNRPVFERCHDHCLSNYSLASFYGCADKHWLKDAIIIYNVKIFSDDKMYVEALIDDIFSQAVLQWNRNRALIPYRYINPLEFVPPTNPILRYIKESSVNEILTDIQRKFRNYLHFDFYTDGSLINHKTEQSSMSCAFYQTNPLSPNTTFNTTLEYNSHRTCPPKQMIDILH